MGGSLLVGGLNASTIAEEVGAVIVGVGSVSLANGPLGLLGGSTGLAQPAQRAASPSGPAPASGNVTPASGPGSASVSRPAAAKAPLGANGTASTAAPSSGGSGSIQRIPPPANKEAANATLDATIKGVVTRSIYESGHDVPNLEICPDLGRNLQVILFL